MDNEKEYKQLIWHSRRGMRELDLLLLPFTTNVYPTLSAIEQAEYRMLIQEEDNILFKWLLNSKTAGNKQALINKIIAHQTLAHQ